MLKVIQTETCIHRAQTYMQTHRKHMQCVSLLGLYSDFTSSACRWAWLLRWGTGETRWHQPDTEQLVLLHQCYLQGEERQAVNNMSPLFHVWLTSCKTIGANANFHIEQIARRLHINHLHFRELRRWRRCWMRNVTERGWSQAYDIQDKWRGPQAVCGPRAVWRTLMLMWNVETGWFLTPIYFDLLTLWSWS